MCNIAQCSAMKGLFCTIPWSRLQQSILQCTVVSYTQNINQTTHFLPLSLSLSLSPTHTHTHVHFQNMEVLTADAPEEFLDAILYFLMKYVLLSFVRSYIHAPFIYLSVPLIVCSSYSIIFLRFHRIFFSLFFESLIYVTTSKTTLHYLFSNNAEILSDCRQVILW